MHTFKQNGKRYKLISIYPNYIKSMCKHCDLTGCTTTDKIACKLIAEIKYPNVTVLKEITK